MSPEDLNMLTPWEVTFGFIPTREDYKDEEDWDYDRTHFEKENIQPGSCVTISSRETGDYDERGGHGQLEGRYGPGVGHMKYMGRAALRGKERWLTRVRLPRGPVIAFWDEYAVVKDVIDQAIAACHAAEPDYLSANSIDWYVLTKDREGGYSQLSSKASDPKRAADTEMMRIRHTASPSVKRAIGIKPTYQKASPSLQDRQRASASEARTREQIDRIFEMEGLRMRAVATRLNGDEEEFPALLSLETAPKVNGGQWRVTLFNADAGLFHVNFDMDGPPELEALLDASIEGGYGIEYVLLQCLETETGETYKNLRLEHVSH